MLNSFFTLPPRISRTQSRMSLIIRHYHSACDLRNTEMSGEVRKVKGADGPGNHDEVNLIRPGQKNCDITNRIVLPADPEIAHTLAFSLIMLIHEPFPARCAVLLVHGTQSVRIILPYSRKTVPVHRDAAHTCDHAAQVLVVRIQLG